MYTLLNTQTYSTQFFFTQIKILIFNLHNFPTILTLFFPTFKRFSLQNYKTLNQLLNMLLFNSILTVKLRVKLRKNVCINI